MEPFFFFDYNLLNLGYDSNHAKCSAWNKFIIAHEYGHHIMYKAYDDSWPPRSTNKMRYAIFYLYFLWTLVMTESNEQFALVEGWAEFVQNAMYEDWQNNLLRLENNFLMN